MKRRGANGKGLSSKPLLLEKQLGLWDVYALATGATLSSGFFLLPGLAAVSAGKLGRVTPGGCAGLRNTTNHDCRGANPMGTTVRPPSMRQSVTSLRSPLTGSQISGCFPETRKVH